MALSILCATTGKTVNLDFSATNTVEDVQNVLHTLTGVPPSRQILIHEGKTLTPSTQLSQLSEQGTDIFLYDKALFLEDAPEPVAEKLHCEGFIDGEQEQGGEQHRPHPLDSSPSPALRALPQYHREFQAHAARAAGEVAKGTRWLQVGLRLTHEAEVIACSVDAALQGVVPNYESVCSEADAFLNRFQSCWPRHESVLSSFEEDLSSVESLVLPESIVSSPKCPPNTKTLGDIIDGTSLRKLAAECSRSHSHFSSKVKEMEALFAGVRADVEALLLRAPTVDLGLLAASADKAGKAAQEAESLFQALAADLKKANHALDQGLLATTDTGTRGKDPRDSLLALESMHQTHVQNILPGIDECGKILNEFAQFALETKNALRVDSWNVLRTVTAQQSKIRSLKETMSPFLAALEKQDCRVKQLLSVRWLGAGYRQCLAEACRRQAFLSKFNAFAKDLSSRMDHFRSKESQVRLNFTQQIQGIKVIPPWLLQACGFDQPPPSCRVQVVEEETQGGRLVHVTPEDVRSVVFPFSHQLKRPQFFAAPINALTVEESQVEALELQNAILKADIATLMAAECFRDIDTSKSAGTPRPVVDRYERALAAKDEVIAALQERIESLKASATSKPGYRTDHSASDMMTPSFSSSAE